MHIIPSNQCLYLMGDYHQGFIELTYSLEAMPMGSSLIILGDYDAYTGKDLVDLSVIAQTHQIVMYLMRGNHDNPQYWQDRELAKTIETDHLKLLADVDYLQWGELNLLCVSGAVSVDRTGVRFDDGNCWPDTEGIPKDSVQQIEHRAPCDVLLTHSGIIDGMTVDNNFIHTYASNDKNLITDLKLERELIKTLQISSGCTRHYFGHFHQKWSGQQFGVEVRCLDICELTNLE